MNNQLNLKRNKNISSVSLKRKENMKFLLIKKGFFNISPTQKKTVCLLEYLKKLLNVF